VGDLYHFKTFHARAPPRQVKEAAAPDVIFYLLAITLWYIFVGYPVFGCLHRKMEQTGRQVAMSAVRHADPEFCLPREDHAKHNYSLY